ncbi:S100P-binding protein-like [Antechinus flavipes]|uniref:S100P-binding protein-like n=1 Tax=Antechinus flavipes TaxID=38775 RepID=UPI0022364CA6|nr:S100P-binding protein-like [Antechinus flavipes]
MSKDLSGCLESPTGCDSSGSGQHLLPVPGTSWATSGQDEDDLDDSLLELSEGEEDDSPFSYTEEEIQELLKDDDVLNDQSSLGGGLKSAGGQMEKLGRDSCVSLDSPQDINSPCSLELGAGPASSILQLPQVSTPASHSLIPTKLSSRPSAPEKNLLKVTTVPPFKPIVWNGIFGKDKMESSKGACRNADRFGRPSHLGEDGNKDSTSRNNSKPLTGHEETTSASSVWEGPLSPSKGNPQHMVYGTKMPWRDVPTPLISLTLEQTGSPSDGKLSLGNRRHKISGVSRSPAVPSSSGKRIILDKDSGKMMAHETRVSKITPLLPTRARSKYPRFSQVELEPKMSTSSFKNGVTRVPKPRALHQGSLGELYALMDQVASVEYQIQNRRWQHLSALTMINYPRFRQKPLQRYSLI